VQQEEEMTTKKIPDGFHSVTPHLSVKGAAAAIDFYKKAFGAEEMVRMPLPGDSSKLLHGSIKIGDSVIMLAEEFAGCSMGPISLGGTSVTIHLYVPDVDASMARAQQAGCKVTMPQMDMFWGDRYGQVEDPFGHRWSLATHVRDLSPEEIMKGAEEMCAQMAGQHAPAAQ
jgi:uncharacterized glyoxalase superfamily protein PhnB